MMGERFTITEDHLRLLRRMNVRWQRCEAGAPEIDPKRPYGNGNVEQDIAKIIGTTWDGIEDCDPMPTKLRKRLYEIHLETATALQICLVVGAFKTGTFEMTRQYDRHSWKLVDDEATATPS